MFSRLTKREGEVLALLRGGFTNGEIAARLGCSAATIKNHVSSVIKKLEVSNRTEAAGLEAANVDVRAEPPAMAVLRFDCAEPEGLLRRLADAIVDELTTRLGRRWYPVIARGSTFAAQAASVGDAVATARVLQARYLVEGSLEQFDTRVHLHARLLDASNAHVLWADRFTGPASDLFTLLDELAQRAFDGVFRAALSHVARPQHATEGELAPWLLAARGMWHFWRREPAANARARELFASALALDARDRLALYGLALTHQRDLYELWSPSPAEAATSLADVSRRFLLAWPDDAWANLMSAYAEVYRGERERALLLAQRSAELEPSLLGARSLHGQLLAMDGQADDAVVEIERALRLSPCTSERWVYECVMALAHFAGNRYAEAAAWAERAAATSNGTGAMAYGVLASARAQLGEVAPAREAGASFRALQPTFSSAAFRPMIASTRPDIAARYLEGLQRACSC